MYHFKTTQVMELGIGLALLLAGITAFCWST